MVLMSSGRWQCAVPPAALGRCPGRVALVGSWHSACGHAQLLAHISQWPARPSMQTALRPRAAAAAHRYYRPHPGAACLAPTSVGCVPPYQEARAWALCSVCS